MAGGAIAGALVVGTPTALAAPGDDGTTDTEAPSAPEMTGEEALAIIQRDYDTGAGGGQVSKLVHEVLVLRNLGFRPSNANKKAIVAALDKRPNQGPLVEALKNTIAYQRKIQAQAVAQQQQGAQPGFAIGGSPAPFDPGGVIIGGPGGSSVTMPVG
ncbi:hypothetical protein [Mycolicibacterium agri]|uniref:hypothetical protein n=1 Tax=Mycolicibacterium agri TaxID=36811 RepID=UPI001F1C59FD|nr:hypothetical protein [Mycolicibacterium agri]